jgi:hypothetical protein
VHWLYTHVSVSTVSARFASFPLTYHPAKLVNPTPNTQVLIYGFLTERVTFPPPSSSIRETLKGSAGVYSLVGREPNASFQHTRLSDMLRCTTRLYSRPHSHDSWREQQDTTRRSLHHRSQGLCVRLLSFPTPPNRRGISLCFRTIPLISYDLFLNGFLTTMFLWPLYRSSMMSHNLRRVATRTL